MQRRQTQVRKESLGDGGKNYISTTAFCSQNIWGHQLGRFVLRRTQEPNWILVIIGQEKEKVKVKVKKSRVFQERRHVRADRMDCLFSKSRNRVAPIAITASKPSKTFLFIKIS